MMARLNDPKMDSLEARKFVYSLPNTIEIMLSICLPILFFFESHDFLTRFLNMPIVKKRFIRQNLEIARLVGRLLHHSFTQCL